MWRRKLCLSSPLFTKTTTTTSWAWPSCKQPPRTNSFRGIVNSVYDSTEYSITHSSEDNDSESFSTTSDNDDPENLIRGLTASSDRLFFEPGGNTSSILTSKEGGLVLFKESVAMALDTEDPYLDFKKSMEEMVTAHGIKEWECLEELLVWYLRVNGKKTHGYIVCAFVDLLVGLNAYKINYKTLPCPSSSSSLSLYSRNCHEIEEVEGSGWC